MKTRILIDSRAREGGDVKDFWMELRPTIENIRKVSLVWGDIPNPLQSPGGPYFLIRIPELGTRTRVVGSSFRSAAAGVTTTTSGRRRGGPINAITGLVWDVVNYGVGSVAESQGITDPTTDPVTDPATDPATDPVTDPVVAPTIYANTSGLETTFVVPITVNVDERVFYSPETAFAQEMNYNPPISIQRLSVNISRNYDSTQITGESVLILELEHD